MGHGQRVGELHADGEGRIHREPPASRNQVRHRNALDVFHREKVDALGFTQVV